MSCERRGGRCGAALQQLSPAGRLESGPSRQLQCKGSRVVGTEGGSHKKQCTASETFSTRCETSWQGGAINTSVGPPSTTHLLPASHSTRGALCPGRVALSHGRGGVGSCAEGGAGQGSAGGSRRDGQLADIRVHQLYKGG